MMKLQTLTNRESLILALTAFALLTESGWAQEARQADSLPPGADSVMTDPSPGSAGAPGSSATSTALPELSNTPGSDQDLAGGAATLTGQGAKDTLSPTANGESRRFKYAFRLSANTNFDDNIFLEDHHRINDTYFVIEPGITLGFGDVIDQTANYIRLDYAPSIFLFAQHKRNDAVQELVRLAGQYTFSKLTISGSQEVQILNGADLNSLNSSGDTTARTNVDVSGRTRVNIYSSRLDATYPLTGKISLEFGGQYTRDDYKTLLNSSNLSGNLYLNYAYSPKLGLGAGLTGGWQFVEGGADQGYLQTNVRANYQLSGKVSVTGTAGIEFRQSTDQSSVDVTPVFELDTVYQATDSTSFTLSTSRRVVASAVLNSQDFESTAVTIGARQRFLQKLFLGVSAGYENDDYVSEQTGVNASREDHYFVIRPSVDYPIREGITVSIFYVYRANHSSGAGDYSFADNQAGITATFSF